jgi:CheY-like chemotaxis protein
MLKILVIDDDPPLRERYRIDLEREGYRVLTTGSSFEGLELIERASPDLVIYDTENRDIDGLEAIERLTAHCPRIPVLATTPGALGCSESDALARAADAVAPRTSNTTILRSQVRRLLAPDSC